jgi:hypothetical protein
MLAGMTANTGDEQLAQNIALVDREIRDSYSAASVEDIRPIASRDFASIGLELPDDQLEAYAQAVADGSEYEFPEL